MTPAALTRLSLLLLLLTPAVAAAQHPASLAVLVADPAGLPVPGATVTIAEAGREARTDQRGLAAFSDLAPGTITLVATCDGFDPITQHGILIRAGQPASAVVAFLAVRSRATQVDVIGEQDTTIRLIPGAIALIPARDLAAAHAFDATEVLRRVPGLSVREDSGPVGARLNVGLRGLNPDRSRQVLMLEDGLPLALAPYGEPEMYYSPPVERMERIEVVKGSGSILYGPQTIGGVINFVTPDPPRRPVGSAALTLGDRHLSIAQVSAGTTIGRAGVFASGLRKQGDGFRSMGFAITDGTVKATWTFAPAKSLSLKLNAHDERSNSTYLGLTGPQFASSADHNAVPDDRLDVERLFASLHGRFALGARTVVTTSAFAYRTTRYWRRQDFDRRAVAGRHYLAVDGDPSVSGGAIFLRDSSGSRDRAFDVAGAETRLVTDRAWRGRAVSIEAGARLLHERATDQYLQWTSVTGGSSTLRDDERRPGLGASAFVLGRLALWRTVTLTPGLRFEHYRYTRDIRRTRVNGVPTAVSITGGDTVAKPLPGIGLAWQATGHTTLFTGVHRGFAPPRVKDAIRGDGASLELDAELSWNYEAGWRWTPRPGLHAEATAFVLDFSNQITPGAASGGAVTTLVNGGRTLHRGFEFAAGADMAAAGSRASGPFINVRYAWLPVARFVGGRYGGNRLPYAPAHTGHVCFGWRMRDGWSVSADASLTGAQYADNDQTTVATADGTIGTIPRFVVWNVAVERRLTRGRAGVTPFLAVKNAGNLVYVASRAPEGIQPGPFRQANGGVRITF